MNIVSSSIGHQVAGVERTETKEEPKSGEKPEETAETEEEPFQNHCESEEFEITDGDKSFEEEQE